MRVPTNRIQADSEHDRALEMRLGTAYRNRGAPPVESAEYGCYGGLRPVPVGSGWIEGTGEGTDPRHRTPRFAACLWLLGQAGESNEKPAVGYIGSPAGFAAGASSCSQSVLYAHAP